MRLSNQIVFASTNRHKLEEFRSILKTYPEIDLIPADEVLFNAGKLGLVEKYETYLENAIAKARTANWGAHYTALADDSGLEIMALEGRPGVKSARYAIPKAGQTRDQANVAKVLDEMKSTPEGAQREARFMCAVALTIEGLTLTAEGVLEGTIATTPRGAHGFGYDPIFIPKGHTKTLAEMSSGEKNELSHRAKAIHSLMAQVKAKGIIFARP